MTSFSSTIINQNFVQVTLEEALALVEQGADKEVWKKAMSLMEEICKAHQEFTTDILWERLDGLGIVVREPRVVGAIVRAAESKGWCKPTGKYTCTTRPVAHRRPVRLWRSLLLAP